MTLIHVKSGLCIYNSVFQFPPEYDYGNNLSPSFYDYPEYPQYNNIQEYHHDEEYHHQHQSQAPAGWTQHHRVVSPGHHSTRRVTTAAERQDGVLTGGIHTVLLQILQRYTSQTFHRHPTFKYQYTDAFY